MKSDTEGGCRVLI